MAIVDVTEYNQQAGEFTGRAIPAGQEPFAAEQQVAITGGSVQSNPFSDQTKFIRVHTDASCRIAISGNPTASGTTKRMAANSTEYFGVRPGHKLAVITSA